MTHQIKMTEIESYIFFDIETTGLPWQEKNRTKITELSFVAVSRRDLLKTNYGDCPPTGKLTLVFNPQKPIHPDVVLMNGLSNELLQYAPLFGQKLDTIVSFIQNLPKPVCLVAHNGNNFDFKIFLAEFKDVNFSLPSDLLCVDSLVGFRKILSSDVSNLNEKKVEKSIVLNKQDDLMTDDEDEWPDLDVSTEDWEDIDKLCDSFSDISCEDVTEIRENSMEGNTNSKTSCTEAIKNQTKKQVSRKKVVKDVFKKDCRKNKESYALAAIYRKLLNREPHNHHRAEDDCLMLLQCVVATKDHFIPWADSACIRLSEIKPLVRY